MQEMKEFLQNAWGRDQECGVAHVHLANLLHSKIAMPSRQLSMGTWTVHEVRVGGAAFTWGLRVWAV